MSPRPIESQATMLRPSAPVFPPEHRVAEMNRWLHSRPAEAEYNWWDVFANEFFDDRATMTIQFFQDVPQTYTIGRTLVPRFFNTIFDSGAVDLTFNLKMYKNSCQGNTVILECERANMTTKFGPPVNATAVSEGKLTLEFLYGETIRIKSWDFRIQHCDELVSRSVLAASAQDPSAISGLSEVFTRQGLTTQTLNFLRLCLILEPMQTLMGHYKAMNMPPGECLKTLVHRRWQRVAQASGAPATPTVTLEEPRPLTKSSKTTKRRKRKSSAPGAAPVSTASKGESVKMAKPSSVLLAPDVYARAIPSVMAGSSIPGDVMVVGEPTLMGGDMGEDDERKIIRLENSTYDPRQPVAVATGAAAGQMGGPRQPIAGEEGAGGSLGSFTQMEGLVESTSGVEGGAGPRGEGAPAAGGGAATPCDGVAGARDGSSAALEDAPLEEDPLTAAWKQQQVDSTTPTEANQTPAKGPEGNDN